MYPKNSKAQASANLHGLPVNPRHSSHIYRNLLYIHAYYHLCLQGNPPARGLELCVKKSIPGIAFYHGFHETEKQTCWSLLRSKKHDSYKSFSSVNDPLRSLGGGTDQTHTRFLHTSQGSGEADNRRFRGSGSNIVCSGFTILFILFL